MLCEKCHEREATCHSTTILDGVTQAADLCSECFDASASPETREMTEAGRAAHCQYCGGYSCAGGTDFFALATGVQQMRFMCVPCTQEYYRYTQQELQRVSAGLSQEEQLAAVRSLRDAADTHMKQWISER
jgi:protein-arginine kinase activator protein McsA